MAAPGDVVFCRDDEAEHSDIWDDRALIKAYDNAVHVMKSRLAAKKGESAPEEEEDEKPQPKPVAKGKKNKKGKRKRNNKDTGSQWKAGQHCRAVFTEDGKVYEAVIKSINCSRGTCVVRYLGYGNEEEQSLQDLLPPGAEAGSSVGNLSFQSMSDLASESEGMEWVPSGASPRAPQRSTKGHRSSSPRGGRNQAPMPQMPPMFPMMQNPLGFSAPFAMPAMPAMPTMPSMPGFPSVPQTMGVNMSMPPPPPPPEDMEDMCGDKEALYSMLISWYMSGYHTGYYQGLKQSKKQESTPSSREGKPKTPSASGGNISAGSKENLDASSSR